MNVKRILCEIVCIFLFTAGFFALGTQNAASMVTRMDDPDPRGGDLAVFASDIIVEYPLQVGEETKIDVDVHNLAITYATTWHAGDYAEYDFYWESNATVDIKLRVRSSSDPASTNVRLDGTSIGTFNSLMAFEIVTIHDIFIAEGNHTLRVTQVTDSPPQGDSLLIDWIKMGNMTLEGELYDRSYGTDSNANFRGVDAIVPSKIKTRFYIDDILLVENQNVGSHINSVPGDSIYSEVDLILNNGTSNTSAFWTPSISGFHTIKIEINSAMSSDINTSNNIAELTVFVGVPPPVLFINTSQNKNDAVLNWDPPAGPGIDHYLIYRSTTRTGFDFGDVWKNTSIDMDEGESAPVPQRTTWNHTNASNPANSTEYSEQYYYIIRAANSVGQLSYTSRTVGKWTREFPCGASTFSLPLEPMADLYIEDLTNDMGADYIRYLNHTTCNWTQHSSGQESQEDTKMRLGEGYQVGFNSQTNYTFCGMPAAMIRHDSESILGFHSSSEARSLGASVDPSGNVTLTWNRPLKMAIGEYYNVYRSITRDGFFNGSATLMDSIPYGQEQWVNPYAAQLGTQYYYMIIPENETGEEGASTYSIGVWTEEFLSEYDTFGIPLELDNEYNVSWYCDNIPHIVGVNYYNINEQRWCWHSVRMPAGAFDVIVGMGIGYQISTSAVTKFTFIGI